MPTQINAHLKLVDVYPDSSKIHFISAMEYGEEFLKMLLKKERRKDSNSHWYSTSEQKIISLKGRLH